MFIWHVKLLFNSFPTLAHHLTKVSKSKVFVDVTVFANVARHKIHQQPTTYHFASKITPTWMLIGEISHQIHWLKSSVLSMPLKSYYIWRYDHQMPSNPWIIPEVLQSGDQWLMSIIPGTITTDCDDLKGHPRLRFCLSALDGALEGLRRHKVKILRGKPWNLLQTNEVCAYEYILYFNICLLYNLYKSIHAHSVCANTLLICIDYVYVSAYLIDLPMYHMYIYS